MRRIELATWSRWTMFTLVVLALTAWFPQFVLGQGQKESPVTEGVEKEVNFQTEDGWTIYGTLRLPLGAAAGTEVPGVILLHEEKHDRTDFEQVLDNPGLADALKNAGFAVLNIDWRGTGQSMGKNQPIEDHVQLFSPAARKLMYLDVEAAIGFLATHPGVDRNRIAIVASEFSAEPAVRAIRKSLTFIRALVLMSGSNLSQKSKDYLASSDMPIFVSTSLDDKRILGDMAEVYSRSKSKASYMLASPGGARGYRLFLAELIREPSKRTPYMLDTLVEWLTTQVKSLGRVKPVSFKTTDGWTIHGNFRYPDSLVRSEKKVPAVIIVPGARSNRFGLLKFEQELARRGFAVLNIEMRGRGQSRKGSALESPEIRKVWRETLQASIHLDTQAALAFLTSQQGIDVNKIGVMGVSIGTKSAVLATAGDPRVKTLVLMSVFGDDLKVQEAVANTTIPILLIDVEKNIFTRERTEQLYEIAKNARLVIYPVIGQGEHVPELAPEVVELVGDWMEEKLP